MLWAATTNSAPTLYWTLYYILSTKYNTENNIYDLVRDEADVIYSHRKFASKVANNSEGGADGSAGGEVKTSMFMEVDKDEEGNAVGLVSILICRFLSTKEAYPSH